MQNLYESSLIIHFEEKADPYNTNKKITSDCLSILMTGVERIHLLSSSSIILAIAEFFPCAENRSQSWTTPTRKLTGGRLHFD